MKFKDIPKSDRPREMMRRCGAQALSDRDLLAVLLGRGTRLTALTTNEEHTRL